MKSRVAVLLLGDGSWCSVDRSVRGTVGQFQHWQSMAPATARAYFCWLIICALAAHLNVLFHPCIIGINLETSYEFSYSSQSFL